MAEDFLNDEKHRSLDSGNKTNTKKDKPKK